MKISGTQTIPLPPTEAYRRMQDPVVLAACMPGCEGLELIGKDEYKMKMKMAMASLSGAFDGKVTITEQTPPTSFKLAVEGSGKLGFMKGHGLLNFSASGDSASAAGDVHTNVAYEGDVQVGGTIAAVGQRLIDATAKMMIKKFFEKLASLPAAA
ncbi:MAG: carbon monoxide dehydrogenase subunit G [Acidobacteriota bacterium]